MTTKELTTSCFDGISKELKSKLHYREGRVKKHLTAAKKSLFDLAEEFAGARDDCNAADSDSTFAKWADETFGMSRSSAYRIVGVFDRIVRPYVSPNVGTGSDLNFIGFDDSALYDLSQKDTPEKAIKDAIKIAKKGGRLTHKQAKELIASYTVEAEPEEPEDEQEADDENTVDAESVTPTAEPCPNCGGTEWTEDESGIACSACSHPQGEPLGEDDKSIELPSWAISKPSVDAFRIAVNSLLKSLKDAPKTPGFELIHKHGARVRLDLENAKAALVGCVPHEYCPYCNGLANDCQPCSNRGWMNKVDYENTPKEVRREAEKLPSGGGR